MNPLEMMKMKNKMTEFTNRHPMLPKFFNRAALEIKEDTVIDLVITPKDGTPIKTNIKVTKEDLELLETLKNMKNQSINDIYFKREEMLIWDFLKTRQ